MVLMAISKSFYTICLLLLHIHRTSVFWIMGCGSSNAAGSYQSDVNTMWNQVRRTVDSSTKTNDKKLVIRRSGWKTVRIFVSSTFRDFHAEREILIKEVSLGCAQINGCGCCSGYSMGLMLQRMFMGQSSQSHSCSRFAGHKLNWAKNFCWP